MLSPLRRLFRRFRGAQEDSPDNFLYNQRLWDTYAARWEWGRVKAESGTFPKGSPEGSEPRLLGDEWGDPASIEEIVANYILPFVTPQSLVAEIGVGGARIAARVAPHVRNLLCFDISTEMLTKARAALADRPNVEFVLLSEPGLPRAFGARFDFVYAFDVFVHLDLHSLWKYFQEIQRILKPGGKAFLHTTNLKAPAGWRRFAAQERYSVEGHYFISPEIVGILASHAGLQIIKQGEERSSNFYLERDGLFIVQSAGQR